MSALNLGVFLTSYRQTYEIAVGSQEQTIKFANMPIQFEWMEISLVYDKSIQHMTAYDSYDLEMAAREISNIKIENAKVYGPATDLSYNLTDEINKVKIYSNFVAYQCNGFSTAPLTQYRGSDIYQKLTTYDKYFTDSDERIYIDLRVSRGYTDELEKLVRNDSNVNLIVTLKKSATKKFRLQITTFSKVEYFYLHGNKGQLMKMQRYEVIKESTI